MTVQPWAADPDRGADDDVAVRVITSASWWQPPAVTLTDCEVNALSWTLLAAIGALNAHQDHDPDAVEAVELLGLVRDDLRRRQLAALERARMACQPVRGTELVGADGQPPARNLLALPSPQHADVDAACQPTVFTVTRDRPTGSSAYSTPHWPDAREHLLGLLDQHAAEASAMGATTIAEQASTVVERVPPGPPHRWDAQVGACRYRLDRHTPHVHPDVASEPADPTDVAAPAGVRGASSIPARAAGERAAQHQRSPQTPPSGPHTPATRPVRGLVAVPITEVPSVMPFDPPALPDPPGQPPQVKGVAGQ